MGRGRPGQGLRQIEFTVRSDLVVRARHAAEDRDVSPSAIVEGALRDYLQAPGARPALGKDAPRMRLRVRWREDVIGELLGATHALGVSERLLVEAALARAFPPVRGPRWDPNRPSADP